MNTVCPPSLDLSDDLSGMKSGRDDMCIAIPTLRSLCLCGETSSAHSHVSSISPSRFSHPIQPILKISCMAARPKELVTGRTPMKLILRAIDVVRD